MINGLLAGNVRWAAARAGGALTPFSRAPVSSPSLFWVSCCECVDPAAEILGLEAGAVFEHRNLANQAPAQDANFLSALQFALETLEVSAIVVCGHYGCRAVRAALDNTAEGLVGHWLQPVRNLCRDVSPLGEREGDPEFQARLLCERNVAAQIELLATNPLVREAWARRRPLSLHGWIYAPGDGLIRDLEVSRSGQAPLAASTRRGAG